MPKVEITYLGKGNVIQLMGSAWNRIGTFKNLVGKSWKVGEAGALEACQS